MDFIIMVILGVVGTALVAGGIVAYRGSTRTIVRVFSAAAIAAGVVMWAVVLLTIPVSRTTSGPQEPVAIHLTTEGFLVNDSV